MKSDAVLFFATAFVAVAATALPGQFLKHGGTLASQQDADSLAVRDTTFVPDTSLRDTTRRDTTLRDTTFRDTTRRDSTWKPEPGPKRPRPRR